MRCVRGIRKKVKSGGCLTDFVSELTEKRRENVHNVRAAMNPNSLWGFEGWKKMSALVAVVDQFWMVFGAWGCLVGALGVSGVMVLEKGSGY